MQFVDSKKTQNITSLNFKSSSFLTVTPNHISSATTGHFVKVESENLTCRQSQKRQHEEKSDERREHGTVTLALKNDAL